MDRRIFEDIDQWPQDRLVIRVNWFRVAFALLPLIMILAALGFKSVSERYPQAAARAPLAATEVPSGPKAESTLQLVAEPWSQGADLVPLGIFVSGPRELASAAAVEVIGLPSGSILSVGRSLGDRWRIPVARLSGAAILPPLHFSGAVDLEVELRLADDTLVERRSVRRAMTDPDLATEETVPPPGKAERDNKSGARPARAADAGNAQAALLRAERLLAEGDIPATRLLLRRAAELGNARAALLLGQTYEGGADADSATAATWYKMAADLGSAEARQRLNRPASGDAPSRR